ncbi:MAG: hypothetical protein ACJ79H_09995 [Myxococcales bacterium]
MDNVAAAPKQAFKFAENHVLAFLLVVVLLAVLFVKYETDKPGEIRKKVQKIPGVGPWATGVQNP